jgi:hypothetical protein
VAQAAEPQGFQAARRGWCHAGVTAGNDEVAVWHLGPALPSSGTSRPRFTQRGWPTFLSQPHRTAEPPRPKFLSLPYSRSALVQVITGALTPRPRPPPGCVDLLHRQRHRDRRGPRPARCSGRTAARVAVKLTGESPGCDLRRGRPRPALFRADPVARAADMAAARAAGRARAAFRPRAGVAASARAPRPGFAAGRESEDHAEEAQRNDLLHALSPFQFGR